LKNEQLSFIHYQLGACEFLEVSSDKVERTLEELYIIYSVFSCISPPELYIINYKLSIKHYFPANSAANKEIIVIFAAESRGQA
jgi:hypothetical protein